MKTEAGIVHIQYLSRAQCRSLLIKGWGHFGISELFGWGQYLSVMPGLLSEQGVRVAVLVSWLIRDYGRFSCQKNAVGMERRVICRKATCSGGRVAFHA